MNDGSFIVDSPALRIEVNQSLIARQADGLSRLPVTTRKVLLAHLSENKHLDSFLVLNKLWALVEAPAETINEVIPTRISSRRKTNSNLADRKKRLLRKAIKSIEAVQRNGRFPAVEVFELFRSQLLDLLHDPSLIGTHERYQYAGADSSGQSLSLLKREVVKLQNDRSKIEPIVIGTPNYRPQLDMNKLKKIANQHGIEFNPHNLGESLHTLRCEITRRYSWYKRRLNREIKDTMRGTNGQINLITKLQDITRTYDQNLEMIVSSINEIHRGSRHNHIDVFYDNLEYRNKQVKLRCQFERLVSKSVKMLRSEGIVEELFLWWRELIRKTPAYTKSDAGTQGPFFDLVTYALTNQGLPSGASTVERLITSVRHKYNLLQ